MYFVLEIRRLRCQVLCLNAGNCWFCWPALQAWARDGKDCGVAAGA